MLPYILLHQVLSFLQFINLILDLFFVSAISVLLIFFALRFGKKVRVRDKEKLMIEIENDIIDEFNLDPSKVGDIKTEDLNGVVEWIEDIQLEDKINNKL